MPTRHRSILVCVGLALLVVPAASSEAAEAAREKPSLVLVTIDTLRADRLGCYGYHRDTSPNMDAFAEQSILFENAYTTMATTLPAHASMMTGTYPIKHGVQANVAFLPRSLDDAGFLRTLAEMLSNQGYDTAAFVSAAPLKRHSGIDRGFAVFSQPAVWQRNCNKTTEKALKWLDGRSEKPFFLWVHYFDPHWPYSPPKKYRDRFQGISDTAEYLEKIGVSDSRSQKIIEANNDYDAEILYTDAAVGRLFSRLRKLGAWDASTVVLTADHGEGLGQHDMMYHGEIYNEHLRVPLMIKLPGQTESRRVGRVTSLVDLLPILSASTRLPIMPADRRQFQGIDVLDPEQERDLAFSERVHRKSRNWGPGRKYAVTGADWKYAYSSESGDTLYDLRKDPHEIKNVIELFPEVANELRTALFDRIQKHRSDLESKKAPVIDRETLDQLRSLGYIE